MTEKIEHQEMVVNDNIQEVVNDVLEEREDSPIASQGERRKKATELLRKQLIEREASLTNRDEVINHLENQMKKMEEISTKKDVIIDTYKKHVKSQDEQKEKAIKLTLGDKFTLLRHQVQDLEELKEAFNYQMEQVHDLIDDLEEHFL
tara:strand:+ start:760 stop:1203 length:444 start_codon:yes stop_codon:yes gene_type:complete